MAISSLIVAIRATGVAALGRVSAGFTQAGRAASGLGNRVSSLTRRMFAQTRQVSSVAGAYRDANGTWRNANGTLLVQRHTVTSVTTAYGRLVRTLHRVRRAAIGAMIALRLLNSSGSGPGRLASLFGQFAVMAGALGVKLGVVLAVAIPLAGTLVSLLNLVQLLAPATVAAAAAGATLFLALRGVGGAISAGLSGDTEEYTKALAKLAPSARETVRAIVGLKKAWSGLAGKVQQRFFVGAASDVKDISAAFRPLAFEFLPKVADAFGRLRHGITQALTESARTGDLKRITEGVTHALSSMIEIGKPLFRVFMDIAAVAAPRLAKIADYLLDGANRFADWIREAKESGKLGMWLDEAMKAFGTLKDIIGDVGRILGAFFRDGRDQGQGMLDTVRDLTDRFATWLESTDGQKFVRGMADVGLAIVQVSSLVVQLAQGVGGLMSLWREHGGIVTGYWNMVVETFRVGVMAIINTVGLVVVAASKAFGWIPGIGPKLKAAEEDFKKFASGVNAALEGIKNKDVTVSVNVRTVGDARQLVKTGGAVRAGNIIGHAAGTPAAPPGWAMVGEKGPELVRFRGGEQVYSNDRSSRMLGGSAGSTLVLDVTGGERGLASLLKSMIRNGDIKLTVTNGQIRVA